MILRRFSSLSCQHIVRAVQDPQTKHTSPIVTVCYLLTGFPLPLAKELTMLSVPAAAARPFFLGAAVDAALRFCAAGSDAAPCDSAGVDARAFLTYLLT